MDTLQSLGYDFQIDMSSIRGFEYYTGVIFQLFSEAEKVGGGGRYDALIPAMGGKDISASGFALYLDTLIQLLPPEKLVSTKMPKILIKIEPSSIGQGFRLADSLREAGYIVKMHLGGKGPTDFSWKLDLRSSAPQIILSDVLKRKKYELNTISEVLRILKS